MLPDNNVILVEEISRSEVNRSDCVTEKSREEMKIFFIIVITLITNEKGRFCFIADAQDTHTVSRSIDLTFLLTVQVLLTLG